MGSPESSANIKFPVSQIDQEIREHLTDYYGVKFNADGSLTEDVGPWDTEIEVEDGLFFMHNSQARDGEFSDLEILLIEKGIPFDRTSYMEWQCPPRCRIFRPANSNLLGRGNLVDLDIRINLDADAYEPVVSVTKIREIIKRGTAIDETEEMQDEVDRIGLIAYQKLIDLLAYLDEIVPPCPPLADYVKEG